MSAIKKLYDAIIEHAELEGSDFKNISGHGADYGVPGFTYTSECVEFYEANKIEIYDLLGDEAEDFGFDNIDAFVATFGRADMLSWEDGRKNLLAWYALEMVASAIEAGVITHKGEAE